VIDNADIQRVARMVADTHRVRVRPLWDDEKMRQTMAAAAGLDKVAKMVADTQRVRMRPLFDTKKLVGPMFGGELQRIAQAMTDAHRVRMRPLWDDEKMRQTMAAAAGLDKVAKMVADTQRVRMRPLFDAQGMVEVAQSILETTIAVPSNATMGDSAPAPVSVPAKAPLFPGLANPWQQVRHWDLIDWIVFINLIVAIAAIWVAMERSRPEIKAPENPGKIIRTVPENANTTISTTSTLPPISTSAANDSELPRPLDVEKGRTPSVGPSPTSSSR
jgi:hypothetical protein